MDCSGFIKKRIELWLEAWNKDEDNTKKNNAQMLYEFYEYLHMCEVERLRA